MPRDLHEAVVLVVEDNPDNLFIVIELLRTKAKVKYCNGRASGRQLFKLIETLPSTPIDLILLDIQIPHEDGYAILKRIRETATLAKTKVVALTANVMDEDVARARAAGFDGFIGKPLDKNRFPEQMARLVRGESVWAPR